MGRTTRNRRRGQGKNPIQFMRGLIVETLGVATLIFLYFTMQASSAGEHAVDQFVITPVSAQFPSSFDSTDFVENDSIWSLLQQQLPQRQKLEALPVWSSFSSNR